MTVAGGSLLACDAGLARLSGCEPLVISGSAATAATGDLRMLRGPLVLLESTKSEMRGTISARNRDPLNTP